MAMHSVNVEFVPKSNCIPGRFLANTHLEQFAIIWPIAVNVTIYSMHLVALGLKSSSASSTGFGFIANLLIFSSMYQLSFSSMTEKRSTNSLSTSFLCPSNNVTCRNITLRAMT